MRLTDYQIQTIRQLARKVGDSQSRVRVFGSRLQKGGLTFLRLSFVKNTNSIKMGGLLLPYAVTKPVNELRVQVFFRVNGFT